MLAIRKAQAQDVGTIVEMICGLAEYEHLDHLAEVTEADLLRDGFGDLPRFHCVIADWDGNPAGFALYFYNYSTFKGRPGIYLEDLFVWPKYRGKGIGKGLLMYIGRIAVEERCGRYEWQVLDWNTPSIEFYEGLGAKRMKEWLPMRVEGEALTELAMKS
jgi:diamine N-acetyltransferase